MKLLHGSNTDEVILEWLKAELKSSRFSDDLKASLKRSGQNENILIQADLNDQAENELRLKVLKGYSWLDFDLRLYEWKWVELDPEDVRGLEYIDYSYWNELSDGTRLVGQAVQNIIKGKVVFNMPHDRFYAVAKEVEEGKDLPPIILLAHDGDEPAEVIEGHLRSTGYLLATKTNHPLKGIIGFTK